jgi:hypothetical protein
VASRWPQRFFLAAFISRSTSASVRYSRVRSLLSGSRLGGTCSIYGDWRCRLVMRCAPVTVRITTLIRTVAKPEPRYGVSHFDSCLSSLVLLSKCQGTGGSLQPSKFQATLSELAFKISLKLSLAL